MRAELRALVSLEVDDLASWRPDGEEWAVSLRILAGPAGEPGEESFDLVVCSAAWLGAQALEQGLVDARHHLVADAFHWTRICSYIEKRVAGCEGSLWPEVAEKVSRLGYWEIEDYTP